MPGLRATEGSPESAQGECFGQRAVVKTDSKYSMPFRIKKYIGLDIGSSGTKAVQICGRPGQPLQALCCSLSNAEEGILNDSELYQGIGNWLRELGWQDCPACLGMPQFLASTLVADFPVVKGAVLARMVNAETRQLAGISDEAFVNDFQPLKSAFGRQGPVLIGICREAPIQEKITAFITNAQGRPETVAMNGLAMANAFLALEKQSAATDKPVLLLDLGQETATACVLAAGQPLFVGTMLVAAERFNKALQSKQSWEVEGEGMARWQNIRLGDESPHSPLLEAARQLESEIQDVVEHWRSQERPELAETPIEQVFVCGGGARIGGLAEWLQQRLEVTVTVFGPEEEGQIRPEFAVAFGLALQAAGKAAIEIALLPPELAWRKRRQKRLPLLWLAMLLLFGPLTLWQVLAWHNYGRQLEQMRDRSTRLELCATLLPELENMQKKVQLHESQLLPVLVGLRAGRQLSTALQALAEVCAEDDWFVYLADEHSYLPAKQQDRPAAATSAPASLFAPAGRSAVGDSFLPPEFPNRRLPQSVDRQEVLISAGYTNFVPSQPYERVREMARRLNESQSFAGVDILPESMRVVREDIFAPWIPFCKKIPRRQFKAFTFRMPVGRTAAAAALDQRAAQDEEEE